MPSQIGNIISAAELAAVISDFATANGWTLNSGVLSKGEAYIRLTTPSVSEIRMESAKNGNFNAPDICPRYSRIFNTDWPATATYTIVAFDNPDTLWCTIHFDLNRYQHIGFGFLEKYGDWEGGTWFHAQHTPQSKDGAVCALIDGNQLPYWDTSPRDCALFWGPQMGYSWSSGYRENSPSSLHCELNGHIWEPPYGISRGQSPYCPNILSPVHKRNPNAFNGQTVLTPYQLFMKDTDGHYMSIGHVGHVRFIKLTNYNPGDEVQLGTDRWRVYPWHIKDARYPDGFQQSYRDGNYSTGYLGVAVRYDGA